MKEVISMEQTHCREKSCAFTGHRPEKLVFAGTGGEAAGYALLFEMLDHAVSGAVNRGYTHFITGMCRGIDLWGAAAVLRMKQTHPEITLEAAVPHLGQEKSWNPTDRELYRRIYDACDVKTVLGDHYTQGCMQRRNRYMVDNAQLIIAVFDPAVSGGTAYTVNYAARHGREIWNLLEKTNAILSLPADGIR